MAQRDRAQTPGPASRALVRSVVEPVVAEAGYDVEDLMLSRAGRRQVIRIVVDGDAGVNLDTVAALSRRISAALDAAEESGRQVSAGEYTLEVSSPGVDRALTLPRHWRRNVGRLVRVTAAHGSVTGRITAADDAGVTLDVAGGPLVVGYPELGPGRIQVEFSRLESERSSEASDAADIAVSEPSGDAADTAVSEPSGEAGDMMARMPEDDLEEMVDEEGKDEA